MDSSEDQINAQDLAVNCYRCGENYEEWINWGSFPNKLGKNELQSEKANKKMDKISLMVIQGYVRNYREKLGISFAVECTISKYWRPPVLSYHIIWEYYDPRPGDVCILSGRTPITDEEGPEWKEEGENE